MLLKSELPPEEPSQLSAVTVAKGIEYGVKLLGCFIEAYVGSKQGLGKEGDLGKMTHAALEFARGTFAACSDEHNWYEHFQLLMRHPVIMPGYRSPLGIITAFQRISSVPDPLQNFTRSHHLVRATQLANITRICPVHLRVSPCWKPWNFYVSPKSPKAVRIWAIRRLLLSLVPGVNMSSAMTNALTVKPSCFASWTGCARHSGAVIYSLHPAFDMRTHESVC